MFKIWNKKVAISLVVILLLTIAGGIFWWWLGTIELEKEEEYVSVPTRWSLAEDYVIQEDAERILVTNEEAGFSFVVPKNWTIEGEEIIGSDYLLTMFSPEAKIKEDEFGNRIALLEGCGISLHAFFQEREVWSLRSQISFTKENPGIRSDGTREEVIDVNGFFGYKMINNYKDPIVFERIGKIMSVGIPISDNGIIEFGTTIRSNKLQCTADFNDFIANLSID